MSREWGVEVDMVVMDSESVCTYLFIPSSRSLPLLRSLSFNEYVSVGIQFPIVLRECAIFFHAKLIHARTDNKIVCMKKNKKNAPSMRIKKKNHTIYSEIDCCVRTSRAFSNRQTASVCFFFSFYFMLVSTLSS